MDLLRRFARTDGDHLRQVELKARGVLEELGRGTQYERVHDEIAALRRARDEPAGTLGAPAGEGIRSEGCCVHPGLQLAGDGIHLGG